MKRFIIVGGGIIGVTLARALALREAGEITVLEKETSLAQHASGRNSCVIHSGINQKPGTLKARMCVEGSRLMRQYCRQKDVPMNECGTLVVARTQDELKQLETLLEMGKACGVSGLAVLSKNEFNQREPAASGIGALYSPSGAAVDAVRLLECLAEEAKSLGVKFAWGCKVHRLEEGAVFTNGGIFESDRVINCAGLEADRLAHSMKVGLSYRIIPFRGEYMEVAGGAVQTMIYQPPDLRFPFLKIHMTRETDDRVLAGPSATLAFGREAYKKEWNVRDMAEMFTSTNFWRLLTSREFLKVVWENAAVSFSKRAFLKQIQTLVPAVKLSDLKPYRSGIRAQLVDSKGKFVNDLLVEKTPGTVHVLNVVSPGFTSSLAFAEYLVDQYLLN